MKNWKIVRRTFATLGVILFLMIVFVFFKLEKISKNETSFENAIHNAYIECYKRHGYIVMDSGKNIPPATVKQCRAEVDQLLGVEH